MYQLCKYVHRILWLMCLGLPWLEPAGILHQNLTVVSWNVAVSGVIPYQVSIKTPYSHQKDVYYTICSAALIGKKKAVSSARCFFSYDPYGIGERLCNRRKQFLVTHLYAVAGTVRNVGRYQKDEDGVEQWRRIDCIYMHRRYSFPYGNVAITVTTQPFVYTQYINPIAVAKKYAEYHSKYCEISGYGNVSYTILSDSLLRAKINPVTNRYCTFLHSEDMREFICTESLIGNVLQDESGGILVCRETGMLTESKRGTLVGIMNGKDRFKAVLFTRLSGHSKFIENSRSQLNKPTAYLCILLLKLIRLMTSLLFYFRKMLTLI